MSKKTLGVKLSHKSIDQAIKTLQFLKKQQKSGSLMHDFIELVCEWIIKRANFYIDNSDIGSLVKLDIRNGWEYTITDSGAKITNSTEKAVFVEFGVGLVGKENPHPNASAQLTQPYEYDKRANIYIMDNKVYPTVDKNGMWYFWTNSNELDIPYSAIVDQRGYDDFRGRGREKGKRIIVGTMGAQGVMYAYHALMDAQLELQKPNGDFADIFNKLYKEYIERYLK